MKKKAIKIAASTAVAASAFVAAAPVQQADAATNVNQLATNAQNAGTVLKWAISYEGSADFKTRPFNEFNAAKKAVAAAEAAANKLSATEKLAVQAKLVDAKVQIVRATAYIDAITSSEKIKSLTSNLTAATASGDLGKVETAYHAASFEYKKQAKLLDRVYGQSTRDGIRNAVKPAMESALDAVKYDVTVKMHLDKASALIKESKLEEAAAELAKADYNLTLKDAKFTFKSQLEKSYADVAASLPLQAISATGDGANTVTVKFSKAYTLDKNLTTLEAGQFKISGLTVQSAKLSEDKKSVILTTSTQKANTEYTVTWQGKSVSFKTAAVADTSGIAVNQTDAAYLETTDTRTFTSKLTNSDGTAYVGGVTITLDKANAKITTVNGNLLANGATTWTGVTDSSGNLVFTIGANLDASVTDVIATIKKTDSTETSKKTAKTHFFKLAADGNKTLNIKSFYVSAANDYVYANEFKYKWDTNDQFFINGQLVSQDKFETAISNGDEVSVDYKSKAENTSTWNITKDVTLAADLEFSNPSIDADDTNGITFDGYNYDLSGTAQPGYSVKIYRGSTLMGTAVADSSGNWTLRAVNLTQNVGNTFTAYQYAPGKDGANGVGNEGTATVLINEGEFASESINLEDKGDNGLSRYDVLNFSFERSAYGHKFNDSVKAGTITVTDGQSRTAKLTVKKVADNKLEVTNITDATRGFNYSSTSISIVTTAGVVNQDQLAFNADLSTDTTFKFDVAATPEVKGLVSNVNTATDTFTFNGKTYLLNANTILVDKNGATLNTGVDIIDPANAAINLVNGDQVTVTVENGLTIIKRTATAAELADAKALADAKVQLNKIVTKTNGLVASDYTSGTWTTFVTERNAAALLEEDDLVEVNAKILAYNTAHAKLVFLGQAALTDAKNSLVGLVEGHYTAASWADLGVAKAKPESTNAEVVAKAKAITDAKAALVKTDAQKDLETAVATAASNIAPTFAASGAVGTTVVPTVTGFAVTVKSSSDTSKYAVDGKIVAAGTSSVVYTVTDAAGNKADSKAVTVTVTVTP